MGEKQVLAAVEARRKSPDMKRDNKLIRKIMKKITQSLIKLGKRVISVIFPVWIIK